MEPRALSNLSAFFELAKVLPEAALLLSGGGEILAANPPAAAMLGLSARELRGKSLYDLTTKPPEDVDHHLKAWSRTRALMPGSLSLKAADGQVIDCRCDGAVVQPPTEDSAAIIFLRCVPKAVSNNRFLDLNRGLEALRNEYRRVSQINERLEERVEERTAQLVRYTQELRKSREWSRSLVQNVSDIVWVARADGTLSYVSPSVERILGYRPEDLVDTYGFDLVHPDEVARTQSFYDDVLERPGAIPSVEFRMRRSDGSWCHVESTGSNLLQDPSVSGVVFNSRDISDRKRAEEENNLLRTMALEISEAEDLRSALSITLRRVCEATDWAVGQAWVPNDDETKLECSLVWYAEIDDLVGFRTVNEGLMWEPGLGLPGRAWSSKRTAWTRDITKSSFLRAPIAEEFGLKAGVTIPVLADSEVVAVLDFFMFEEREEDERLVELVSGVAAQLGSVIQGKKAEEALRESEARNRAVVDTASDAIITMSKDGTVRSFNPSAERIFGYASEEIVGQPLRVLMPERFRELHEAGFRRYLDTREAHVIGKGPIELVGLRKSGEEFPLELSLGEMRTGDALMFTGIIRDITERHRAEEALQASEERFRRLVEQAADALFVHDLEGRFVNVNQQACESLGYTQEELLNLSVADVEENFTPEGLSKLWERVVAGGPLTINGVHRRKDGTRFPVEVRVGPLEMGESRLILAAARDVTERKRAEEKLRESEAGLAKAQQVAHLGSWEIDLSTGEMHWSDEMYRIFGFTPGEVTPTREILTEATHPQDREVVPEAIRTAVEKRQPFNIDHRILHSDGEVRFIEAQGEAVFDPSGRPVKLVGTSLDITERKRAEEELRESESRLLAAQRIAHVGNWSFDVVANKAYWSDELYRIFGLSPQEEPAPTYKRFLSRVHPDDRVLVQEASREALDGGNRSSIDYRMVRPDGEVRFVHSQYEVRYDASGRAVELIGTLQDVTELRQKQEEVRRSEERFRSLAQNASDVVAITGDDAIIHYMSPPVERILGYKPEELIGTDGLDLVHPDDLGRTCRLLAQVLSSPGTEVTAELRARHADGSWRYVEAVGKNLIDDPSIGGIVVNYRDTTERKAFEEQLEYQAFYDGLTDLPNRTLFVDRLEHALASLEQIEGKAVAVLFIDLDNFKVINDSLGHTVGDHLLIAVARRLRCCLRAEDTVARFGGDEFAILLKDLEEVSDAVYVAERISEELYTAFKLGGREVFVSPSIGISLGTTASARAEDLLRDADTALHKAKEQGKARYTVFDSDMYDRVLKRLRMEGDLRRALERDEFRVYYQPKMKLDTNLQQYLRFSGSRAMVARKQEATEAPRIVGTEALVRWEHPDLGLVSPAEFIPVAEETSLIVQIRRCVLEEACLQTRRWNDQHPGDPPLTVCVNLSARQFQDPELCQDVARILQETGLDPQYLCLEITESVVMKDVQVTIATLQELKGLGVELSVDDFGTGYSSLSYLKRFPVDYLKIDRSFVEELKKGAEHAMLVSGIIRLAQTLGMQVIAEGVESAEQLKRLQGLGCDLAQGFYFSKPLPGEAMLGLLADVQRESSNGTVEEPS